MTLYVDTSALVPLFFREPGTATARARLEGAGKLTASWWTLAEFSSATAIKVRSGQVDGQTATHARQQFAAFTQARLTLLDVERDDLILAARLCEVAASGLRTGDALHLAIARRVQLPLLTFDGILAQACALHGVRHELLAA